VQGIRGSSEAALARHSNRRPKVPHGDVHMIFKSTD